MKLICSSVYTFILKILSTYYMLEDQPLDYLDRERKWRDGGESFIGI